MNGAGNPGSCDRLRFPGCCRGAADARPIVRRSSAQHLLAGLCQPAWERAEPRRTPHPSPPEYKGAAPAIQSHICIPLTSLHATTGIQSAPLFSQEVCEAQFGFYSLRHLLRRRLGAKISHVQKRLGWIYCLKVTGRDLALSTPVTEGEALSAGHVHMEGQ